MNTTQPTLRVQGHGQINSEPDVVVLSLVVTAEKREYADTIHETNTRAAALRDAISKIGEDPKSLRTTSFTVVANTDYVNGHHVFRGFRGAHSHELRIGFDHDRLSRIFSAITLSSAKAHLNISFTISDPESVRQRVIAAAVANAQQRARIISEAAGQQLGQIISIEYGYVEIRVSSDSFSIGEGVLADIAPEIEPADIESSDTVTIIWKIEHAPTNNA